MPMYPMNLSTPDFSLPQGIDLARATGSSRYLSLKLCKKGHRNATQTFTVRYVKGDTCVKCHLRTSRQAKEKNSASNGRFELDHKMDDILELKALKKITDYDSLLDS